MSWESLRSSLRTRVQAEHEHASNASIIGAMARLSAIAGVMVAALLIPATTFVAVTANNLSQQALDLPLELRQTPNPQTTRLLASNGDLLAYFYNENRQDVPLKEISPNMQNAILSIEDNRFYQHGAIDLKGTIRALINNASDGQTQGGSSITQQLVKLTLVQQATTTEQQKAATEKTTARKIRELKYAISYEKTHTKKEILERYLNIAYFGDGAYGISAAAFHYFSVSPDKLTVQQAATIAGLVKNPVQFDPNAYPERALQRRNTVLSVMARLGKISDHYAELLMAKPLQLKITKYPNGCVSTVAAFSCDYIRRYLLAEPALGATADERKQKLLTGGLTIRSNIDIRMQKAANKAVKKTVDAKDKAIGALAMVEPGTGKVRSVAQSRPLGSDAKKGESSIDFAVPTAYGSSGGFQAGSTFKMFTVNAALKKGLPVSQSYNSPGKLTMPSGTYFDCEGNGTAPWPVNNSTGNGRFNMYSGTRKSVNTYFAQLEKATGLCEVVQSAESMGIQVPKTQQVPSFTLGVVSVSPLDMAAAYATAASGGEYCKPQPIASITDLNDKTIKKYTPQCTRVMSKDDAAQINDILRGVQEPGGFGYDLGGTGLNIPSAAKTGTTSDNQAVWYVGYTPELVTASMIAGVNSKGQPRSLVGRTLNGRTFDFHSVGGSSLAGPMWKLAMGVIQNFLTPTNFDTPPDRQPVATSPKKKTKKAPVDTTPTKPTTKPGGGPPPP